MSYTKEDLRSMASNLCGIDSDSEGVAAINKAIDYLTEQAEKMEIIERGQVMDKEVLIEALEIAISNFQYDNEMEKARETIDYVTKLREGK